MPEPSISIAMCTYNSSRFLREQLDSFANQTRQPDEVIVCDDASSDSTPEIVAAFARAAPFDVRLTVQPRNVGRIPNFETAISLCTKDIIFLSDADDVWHADKLALMSQTLVASHGATGVFCDAEVVDAALKPLGYSHFDHCRFTPELKAQLRAGQAYDALLGSQIVQGAAFAFRASYRPMILPLSRYWGQDSWIAVLLGAAGELLFLDERLLSYRQHDANALGVTRPRPSRLTRWARKLRAPRQHYHTAHDTVTSFLKQMDDLQERMTDHASLAQALPIQGTPPGFAPLLAALERRRSRLLRRKRTIEALLLALGDTSHRQSVSTRMT